MKGTGVKAQKSVDSLQTETDTIWTVILHPRRTLWGLAKEI